MIIHPKLQQLLDTLDLDDPHRAPSDDEWTDLLVQLNQSFSDSERKQFLLDRTLDTLDESSREFKNKVEAEREKLESVLGAIQDGVCALDRRGRLLFINRAGKRLLGATQQQISLDSVLDRFHLTGEAEAAGPKALIEQLNEGKTLRDDDAILEVHDGRQMPISCIFSPILEQQKVAGMVVVFRDVTDQKQAADRMQELNEELTVARDQAVAANRAKSAFLANMSHELRTPLNAVIGYTELIREDSRDFGYGEIEPDLNKIHVAANHLLSLINDILDLSKIEAGRHEIVWETFALSPLIDDVESTVSPHANKNDNALIVKCADDLGEIRADRIKLRQILINLLSNAAKFTSNGTVGLEVRREATELGDQFVFDIYDDGIGISQDELAKLFDPFTQADSSTTREYGGTGLGLTITRHFCQMMGGDISAESVAGEGSTFTVRLPAPLTPGATQLTEASGQRSEPSLPRDNHTVLVIDDDPTVHDLLRRQIGRAGYRVVTADSGVEGLRLARSVSPSVITLDVMMPGRSGWEVLSQLKSDEVVASIPVVMLTMVVDRKKGIALGADDYLVKPVATDTLLEVLSRFDAAGSTRHALVVEDDPATQEVIERAMSRAGWQTTTASNGRLALERLEGAERIPKVILLDLMMPEMDGFEFLREVRKTPAWAEIPVIVVTARQLSRAELEQLELVTERIMQKGNFTGRELVDEIDRIVSQAMILPAEA
ncbi:MAG: response regulator [Persicimonas sp.]